MSRANPQDQAARFDRVYRADDHTYGAEPSLELVRRAFAVWPSTPAVAA